MTSAGTHLPGTFCGRAVLLHSLLYYFCWKNRGEQGQFSGMRSSCTAGIHSHSCRSRHYSTYTGPAGLPALSAAPGTTRGEQRPLAAIQMTRERLLRETKNPFSNKKTPAFLTTQWYYLLSDNTSSHLYLLQSFFFLTAVFVMTVLSFLESF